ncbi:ABC transporter ATP-binding protein [Desmospora activa]|uniref:Peptide/nickel transport system ATP-binding protein/oligopeptide transport system ATP-binding protein n=1 Tax=Desmospora activa DSM 45169 TaxID=1121389 RepID=A0A2T4ZAY2_9BACL|nr:ABC transporter ATP-binding protein [Desmospora activa]PTM59054.1 peptide/nickel transport system ATP-binding protein/oligopeptide transport system ATP-binding protein [Desmospora activa DSM 45169]
MTTPLLEVKDLQVRFQTDAGMIPSVRDCSFTVNPGEIVAIVGESGCGKSVTSLSIMGLLPDYGQVAAGEIFFDDRDLLKLSKKERRKLRGNEIAMIFQEPMTSLNPVFTIGNQIGEVIRLHQGLDQTRTREKSIEMLNRVGIPHPERVIRQFPHQLSGGMRQRVMIAMALSCNPKLLIADEPTTALDVTIQAQILEMMKKLNQEQETGVILITHDLGVVAELADRVVVMYAGKVVEQSPVFELFANPKHPYTRGLLQSIPKMDERREELDSIVGLVPNPLQMPSGCAFHPRCPLASDRCRGESPALTTLSENHTVRCFHA